MLPILITQLLVPIALVAWLALAAPRSWLGAGVRLAATLLALWAIARVGVWMFPPYWMPYVCGVAAVAVTAWRMARSQAVRPMPLGGREWSMVALFSSICLAGGWVVVRSIAGSTPPTGEALELALPFPAGRYLVVNGGAWLGINAHRESSLSTNPRFIPWRGNGWAVDFVAIDRIGRRSTGVLPPDPAAYHIFGVPLLAPCAGKVALAVDGRPDMRVPEYDRPLIAGNHIILECGRAHVVMAHLRSGSVSVRSGDRVEVGERIARIGNSGGSDEPHLHIHAQNPGTIDMPLSGDPIPVAFHGRFLVRGDRVTVR